MVFGIYGVSEREGEEIDEKRRRRPMIDATLKMQGVWH